MTTSNRSQHVAKIANIFGERRGKTETLGEFHYGFHEEICIVILGVNNWDFSRYS